MSRQILGERLVRRIRHDPPESRVLGFEDIETLLDAAAYEELLAREAPELPRGCRVRYFRGTQVGVPSLRAATGHGQGVRELSSQAPLVGLVGTELEGECIELRASQERHLFDGPLRGADGVWQGRAAVFRRCVVPRQRLGVRRFAPLERLGEPCVPVPRLLRTEASDDRLAHPIVRNLDRVAPSGGAYELCRTKRAERGSGALDRRSLRQDADFDGPARDCAHFEQPLRRVRELGHTVEQQVLYFRRLPLRRALSRVPGELRDQVRAADGF